MPSYTLIGTPFSTFTRTIALGLNYKSVAFKQVDVKPQDPIAKHHHPFGYLPTLVIHGDDGKDVYLRESQAIARYIDRVAPEPTLDDAESAVPEKMWEFVSLVASFGLYITPAPLGVFRSWSLTLCWIYHQDFLASRSA